MLETSQKLLVSPCVHTHTPLGQAEPPGEAVHECQTPCLCLILCCPCRAWQEALWRRAYSRSSSRLRSAGGISRGVFSPGLKGWQDKVGPASRVLGAALGMSADAPQTLIFPGSLLDITPQDLSNNGLGFQVPACVQIRVSGGRPPACLFSQAVYL